MKTIITFITTCIILVSPLAIAEENTDNLIPLDAIKEKNAGILTANPKITTFEKTLFAIGRIEATPSSITLVSSRIAGRVVTRPPVIGDIVEQGQIVLKVESRQPGSPPPVIPVKAPAGGMVFKSHINLGQPIEPSEELMYIIDISKVWAVADIPESKAAHVKVGQSAQIKIISLGNKTFEGKLFRFGTEANTSSGTIKAIFLLDNPDLEIRPNMLTEFNIVISSRPKVFSVPKSAIQGDQLNSHVFKRDYEIDHAFRKVPVVVGKVNSDRAEIILQNKELNVIDDIVTEGGYFLSHTNPDKNDLVKALDEAHGHKHNTDGSEITPQQVAAAKATAGGGSAEQGPSSTERVLLYTACGILLILLIFTIFRKKDVS